MPFFGVPIRNGLPIGLGSVAGFGVQQFDPSQLFEGGTVAGAWYDPSDLSTMFTTSAGTTPVAMPGLGSAVSVGLMLDKSQGLVLGSELITPEANRDFSSDTGYWTKEAGVTISGGTANWSATANSDLYRLNVLTVGKWYRITWTISSYTSGNFRLSVGGTTGAFRTAAGTYTETYYAASNGTFAITGQSSATGSVDNISVRELPGNHAISFNDTTARPELRARVNLLTYSEEFDNGAWVKGGLLPFGSGSVANTTATNDPIGGNTADLIVESTASSLHYAGQLFGVTSGTSYFCNVFVKAAGRTKVRISLQMTGEVFAVRFDLSAVTATTTAGAGTASITDVGNGWYKIAATATATATGNGFIEINLVNASNAINYTGDGTSGIYIWGADLRPANIGANVPAYQRIADANTYDTSGFPLYLRFDGIDDSMYTPANLNLSGTDKVAVFAGVRKLGTTLNMVTEFSPNILNNGTFYILGNNLSSNDYGFALRGTAQVTYLPTPYVAPISNVLAVSCDIAGAAIADEIVPRINGVIKQNNPSGSNAGTGNFGTYPLYIGSRNNAQFRFDGHLHSLIIAGSAVSAGNISATEQWVAGKTGITI